MFRKINGYGSDTVNDADKYVSLGFRKNLRTRYYFCFTGDLDSAQKWSTPVTEWLVYDYCLSECGGEVVKRVLLFLEIFK